MRKPCELDRQKELVEKIKNGGLEQEAARALIRPFVKGEGKTEAGMALTFDTDEHAMLHKKRYTKQIAWTALGAVAAIAGVVLCIQTVTSGSYAVWKLCYPLLFAAGLAFALYFFRRSRTEIADCMIDKIRYHYNFFDFNAATEACRGLDLNKEEEQLLDVLYREGYRQRAVLLLDEEHNRVQIRYEELRFYDEAERPADGALGVWQSEQGWTEYARTPEAARKAAEDWLAV